MDAMLALLALAVGYLAGSISFARLVTRVVAPGTDISRLKLTLPGTDAAIESDTVSATSVREHLGARYGCLTAILDMLKVAIPVLVFALYWPDEPYRLIAAGAGIVGHVWPLYYRFVGGRGLSPILGGLLIIDPLGLIINTVAAFVLGILGGSLLFLRWGWLILLIPWFWLTTRDPATVAYMVVANAVYWFAMLPELRQYMALKRRGVARNKEEISRAWSMGGRIGRLADRYSLPALWRRWRGRASPTASRPDR